jgi:hypothetical protein
VTRKPDIEPSDTPLEEVVHERRALRAFEQLGLRTVSDFLATPRQKLLAVRGYGRRTHDHVLEALRSGGATGDRTEEAAPAQAERRPSWLDTLPESLLELPLTTIGLDDEPRTRLGLEESALVGDALRAFSNDREIPGEVRESLRVCLEAVCQIGIGAVHLGPDALLEEPGAETFESRLPGRIHRLHGIFEDWLPDAPIEDQDLLRHLVGYHCRPAPLRSLALRWGVDIEDLRRRERALRATLFEVADGPIATLRAELTADLAAFDGLVGSMHLAAGSVARQLGRRLGDEELPLRLAAFLFDGRFHLVDGLLCDRRPTEIKRIRDRIKLALRGDGVHLPCTLQWLSERVEDDLGPVPGALVEHVLTRRLGLTLRIHPRKGIVVARRRVATAERIETILRERTEPTSLDDIVFSHRDRFGSGARSELVTALRADGRFLELGPQLWSLRPFHVDELELLRGEAERVAAAIANHEGQIDVRSMYDHPLSERCTYLLIDLLRADPKLRDLGRGVFCARDRRTSELVGDLVRQLKRAMGEVPTSRFVQNQPSRRRRLTIRLLERNRNFVSPEPDRIDLLENYPFTGERMRRLLNTVDVHLEQHDVGYATLTSIHEAVQRTDLGGTFLTEHLLLDLLRRNGSSRYDFLGGGSLIARQDVGLPAWIQRRAREVLRMAGRPMTSQQILAEQPELAEFGDAVVELLGADPMLASEDGIGFRLV